MEKEKKIKLVIVSDTHRDNGRLKQVFHIEQPADYFLHLGDSELPETYIEPFFSIKGNCDHFTDYQKTAIIETPYGNIFMIHNLSQMTKDDKFLLDNDIKVVLFGHTHKRYLKKVNGVYYANPGSLVYPRDGLNPSYLVIELSLDKIDIFFKELD